MAILEPFAASTAAGMHTKGGQTAISSRVWLATRGRKARKKSRAWSGVLYIFQLAAMSFLRGKVLLKNEPGQIGLSVSPQASNENMRNGKTRPAICPRKFQP